MKIHKMWGVWNTSWKAYWDIYYHFDLVKMCGYEKKEIKPISVIEVYPGDKKYHLATHWAWFDEEGISMIWPEDGIFEMCFPYGSEIEEKPGRGKKIRVIVIGEDNVQH